MMAFDPGLHALMQADLADHPVIEKKMFGGLAFMLNGHMVSGLHKGGAMYRIGKDSVATALAMPGVRPMMMSARKEMKGFFDADADLMADDARRLALTRLSLDFVQTLPPK